MKIKAMVLRAAGINCDLETEYALTLAGAQAQPMHINELMENKNILDEFQIIVFPGGFSYGDDVAAGKILSNQIIHHLSEALRKFIDDGKLALGICNGFQVMVKAGILPGFNGEKQKNVTITNNNSGKFEDRWVYLEPVSKKCIFIEQAMRIYLPIAHGEGKFVVKDDTVLETLKAGDHIAFKYVDKDGKAGDFPINPNGSTESIAGLTDTTGRVLGLMPHPERFVRKTQHPHFTRLDDAERADGMTIFNNAVRYAKQNL